MDARKHLLTLEVEDHVLRGILHTAVETGSTYWATFSDGEWTSDGDIHKVRLIENEAHEKGRPRAHRLLSAHDMLVGLQRLANVATNSERSAKFPAAIARFTSALDMPDAETADVVLQMAVFGEVVYG